VINVRAKTRSQLGTWKREELENLVWVFRMPRPWRTGPVCTRIAIAFGPRKAPSPDSAAQHIGRVVIAKGHGHFMPIFDLLGAHAVTSGIHLRSLDCRFLQVPRASCLMPDLGGQGFAECVSPDFFQFSCPIE